MSEPTEKQAAPKTEKVAKPTAKPAARVVPEAVVEDDNPEGYPRFVSTTGEAVLIALTRGGHSAGVGTKAQTNGRGTPLHPRFHRMAVQKGCMPIELADSAEYEEDLAGNVNNDRGDIIRKAIADMVALAAEDVTKQKELFTDDGRPNAMQIAERVGFPVSANERDRAWRAYAGDALDD